MSSQPPPPQPQQSSQEYRAQVNEETARNQSSDIDPYGFKRKSEFNYLQYQEIMNEYMPTLTRRAMRWSDVMKNAKNNKVVSRSSQIKRFCRKGIPLEYRAQVWMDLSGARTKMNKQPDLYKKLLQQSSNTDEDSKFKQMESQIEIDLDRTFPDNIYFNGTSTTEDRKGMLSNVLKAYGRHRPDVGYCQGLNYLVGVFLIITRSEEMSFWLMTTLLDDIIPCYYDKSMSQTLAELGVLGELVNERLPEVGEKMKNEHKPWMVISSKWFICLFIDVLPIETVLRVWDCMFCEGSKILVRTALYMVMLKSEQLQSSNGLSQIKSVFDNLDKDSEMLSCHSFIDNMLHKTNPMPTSKVQRLREKHLRLVQQENNS